MSRAKMEWLLFKELMRISSRHIRYAKITLGLYLLGLRMGRRAYFARLGFVFLQVIDDLLDGDRPCNGEPLDEVAALLARVETGRFDLSRPLDRVGAALWVEFGREAAGEEGVAKSIEIIKVMMRDRRRVLDKEIWSEAELRDHHRKTFRYSLDLTFIAIGSRLRADDAPATLDLLGWCSTMRDLREDLRKGLCNVPREAGVVSALGENWVGTPEHSIWATQEWRRAEAWLSDARHQVLNLNGTSGAGVFTMFVSSIGTFHSKKRGFA